MKFFVPHFDFACNFGIDGGSDEVFVGENHGLRTRSGARSERNQSFIVWFEDVFGNTTAMLVGNDRDVLFAKPKTIKSMKFDVFFLLVVWIGFVDGATVEINDIFESFDIMF